MTNGMSGNFAPIRASIIHASFIRASVIRVSRHPCPRHPDIPAPIIPSSHHPCPHHPIIPAHHGSITSHRMPHCVIRVPCHMSHCVHIHTCDICVCLEWISALHVYCPPCISYLLPSHSLLVTSTCMPLCPRCCRGCAALPGDPACSQFPPAHPLLPLPRVVGGMGLISCHAPTAQGGRGHGVAVISCHAPTAQGGSALPGHAMPCHAMPG